MNGSEAPADPLAPLSRAVELASVAFALLILPTVTIALLLRRLELVAVTGVLGVLCAGIYLARLDRPRSWLPTLVTVVRLLATAVLAAVGSAQPAFTVIALALLVFALDGVDGKLARRLDSTSTLGAHLDCETDALLTMVVCLLLYVREPLGAWVLTCGFLRYVYVLVVRVVPSKGIVPRSALRARSFGISLTGLILGFAPVPVLSWLGPALGTALLSWSFGDSFYWSFRNQPRAN